MKENLNHSIYALPST